MAYKIIWTENATDEFLEILSYLEEEWSIGISENFIIEVYSKIDLIAKMPLIGIKSVTYLNTRRILVTKNIALYYKIKVDTNTIDLLNFFDLRQSPERNSFE
jgi:plasmid stabilization system protein ParE